MFTTKVYFMQICAVVVWVQEVHAKYGTTIAGGNLSVCL